MTRDRNKEEQASLLDTIVQESKRLNKLVTDFLAFAKPILPFNALDATSQGEEIRIDLHRDEEEICLRVEDTGKGIPEYNLDRIFDPFFTTKEKGGRIGVGAGVSYHRRTWRNHTGE